VLFAAALVVYGIESLAVPLHAGRDFATYLQYYAQLFHGVALPMNMLYRMPVAPLVIGSSVDFLGAAGTQVVMGLLYALTITVWAVVAAEFGRRAALLTAIALLVFPGFGTFFHAVASDQVFAVGFALWSLALVRSAFRPTTRRFVLVGLGVAGLTLVRPGNQVLVVFALLPLTLVALPWRRRVLTAVACAASAVAVLGVWSVYNGFRFHDYTVARGTNAFLPFYRAFVADHVVTPDAGPASRELAAAVRTHLLTEEPYRSYGITLDTFYAKADARLFEDVVNLSDRVWGWDSDYSKLRAVALEGIRKHPGPYARGILHTLDLELRGVEIAEPPPSTDQGSSVPADTIVVDGRRLPAPSEGGITPAARTGFSSATRDGSIREVWTSPTAHRLVFDDPQDARRYDQMEQLVGRLSGKLPAYQPVDSLRRALNLAARIYPRSTLWLLVAVIALLVRRPRRAWVALAPTAAGLLVVVVNALAIYAILDFEMPVAPAFVVLAAVALLAPRVAEPRPSPSVTSGP
jgi:hypothetical protein